MIKISKSLASVPVLLMTLASLQAQTPALPLVAVEDPPLQVATRFLLSFGKKDFQTVRSLFAPGARVSSVTYSQNGTAQADQSSAEAWMQIASGELASVDGLDFDILQTSVLSFQEGATVSIRFHASGRAGRASFHIEGIDTYSMVRVGGAWRVLQYSYIERLKSAGSAGEAPAGP
jgi:hypothetical protein